MTVDMLIGGFVILMMVAGIVVTMTSSKSRNTGGGTIDEYRRNVSKSESQG